MRKKPQAGDEKFVKGTGKTMIRQQVYSQTMRAWVVSYGRPVWEWVEKGSDRDRTKKKETAHA
ncbi:hypothetical protein D3C71_2217930 [compost metagenome]